MKPKLSSEELMAAEIARGKVKKARDKAFSRATRAHQAKIKAQDRVVTEAASLIKEVEAMAKAKVAGTKAPAKAKETRARNKANKAVTITHATHVQLLSQWRDAVATRDTEMGFTDWIKIVSIPWWKDAVANDKTLLGHADWRS